MAQATWIGVSAVAMWAALALLTDLTGVIPPFQLAAMTFSLGTLVGFAFRGLVGAEAPGKPVPPAVWLIGVGGLFGYHFLYFTALRHAPAAEASLVAYLWPLLIVLGSALMPGERLRWHHLAGAGFGLAGTALLVLKDGGMGFEGRHAFGLACAGGCALVWSSYSLLSRRFSAVPTSTVAWVCLATALLSLLCHLLLEETVWPRGASQWLAVAALGLGPVGAAFYAWDFGVKRGNLPLLGALSYLSPLLSTLVLVAAGRAEPTARIALACLLITAGAVLAAKSLIVRRAAPKPA